MKTIGILTLFLFLCGSAYSSEIDSLVIKVIAWESSGESFEGQVAVANVIKTRAKLRKMTPLSVVLQKSQFSCLRNGKPVQKRNLSEKELANARKAWEQSKVWEYDHYAHYKIDNYWTKQAKSSKRIGNHRFYRL